jgi:Kef-type K+ transport system membrane component KefB
VLNLTTLILQIAIIIGASWALAGLFEKIRQPMVIGEMFAGILLGPSFLGWLAPSLSSRLFPPSSLNNLNALSEVGVVMYMFLVGVALNPRELRERGQVVILTSHVSIVSPFVLGSGLAVYLYPRLADDSVSFTAFALFMGAAMSITAFPVLARILTDRGMLRTSLGTLAIACAAVDDVTGWCILAFITFFTRAQQTAVRPWTTLAGLTAFLVLMFCGARRVLRGFQKQFRLQGRLSESMVALMVVFVMASALVTQELGLHLLFGSFLAGTIMPKDHEFVQYLLGKFESVTGVVLLPLFFAYTGLRTSIRLIEGSDMWFYCLLVVLVAIGGKLGGSMIAARAVGTTWQEAAGLGILMNTRGLMELVILNIGLDLGIISTALFSMMVLMALVTTFMTSPLLEWVCPLHPSRTDSERDAPRQPVTDAWSTSLDLR